MQLKCYFPKQMKVSGQLYYTSASVWLRGVVVITTAQLHSTQPEIRFCAGSNPAHGMPQIRDGEDL